MLCSRDALDNACRSAAALLLVMLSLTPPVESDVIRRPAPSGLSSLSWSHRFNGAQLRVPRSVSRDVRKRQVVLGDVKADQAYQLCMMPGDKPGHCRHLQHCLLEDFRASFPRFLDYLCIIERSYVGVCCPDRPDQEGSISQPAEPSMEFLSPVAQPNTGGNTPDDSEAVFLAKSNIRGCGVSSASSSRVVGGKETVAEQYPWMAALLDADGDHYCGGVLVTDRHVLTAAHCLASVKTSDITVRLGEYDFDRPGETRHRDFHVVQTRSHVDFQKDTYENDIAVLKLHRPVAFNTYIWPVCLPPANQLFENQTAIVAGWGTQFFGGPTSRVLMEVPVPVWEQARCEPRFTQPILDTMLCAAEYGGGKDACQGDSGGPLLYQMPDKRWTTIGVVSWGIRCGEALSPGVYTRVNRYLAWIYTNCVF